MVDIASAPGAFAFLKARSDSRFLARCRYGLWPPTATGRHLSDARSPEITGRGGEARLGERQRRAMNDSSSSTTTSNHVETVRRFAPASEAALMSVQAVAQVVR